MKFLFLSSILVSTATAFNAAPAFTRSAAPLSAVATMDAMDLMCTMNLAHHCVEEECPLDDKEAILTTLDDQRTAMLNRMDELHDTIHDVRQALVAGCKDSQVESLLDSIQGKLSMDVDPTHRPHLSTHLYSEKLAAKELMSDIDTMCVVNIATNCLEDEACDVDMKEAIANTLEEQQSLLDAKVGALELSIGELQSSMQEIKQHVSDVNSLLDSIHTTLSQETDTNIPDHA